MKTTIEFTPATASDIHDIGEIAETSGLFPADILPAMIDPFLNGNPGNDIWLIAREGGQPVAFCFCEPERMTEGTANMLALATSPERRSEGIGARLVKQVEDICRFRGDRILLVETSGLSEFDRTRLFYLREGYSKIASLPEFYAKGEDKIIFMKRL